MTKLQIFSILPQIVMQKKGVIMKAFRVLLQPVAAEFAPVSSAELMVQLLTINIGDGVTVKAVKDAIDYALSPKLVKVFGAKTLQLILEQILKLETLPLLFMRLVLVILQLHPQLKEFVVETLMPSLIKKEVWKLSQLWKGFAKCAEMTMPLSFPALCKLPTEHLESFLTSSPGTEEKLKRYLEADGSTAAREAVGEDFLKRIGVQDI